MDIDWGWIGDHTGTLGDHALIHVRLALLPVLFGLLISLPLGVLCRRWPWMFPPVLTVANILYAIPSLALYMVFVQYTGLTESTVMIPLTLYSLSVLVPNVVDGLASVSEPVRQAATAMGFGPLRRLLQVELPIAVPIVIAGTRVAAVSSISLVAVGQLIGQGRGQVHVRVVGAEGEAAGIAFLVHPHDQLVAGASLLDLQPVQPVGVAAAGPALHRGGRQRERVVHVLAGFGSGEERRGDLRGAPHVPVSGATT